MKIIKHTAYILLLIGGVNWGIYGLSGHDLVDIVFGSVPVIARIIYVLIGLASVYVITHRFSQCSCMECVCETCSSCSCNKPFAKTTPESNPQA